MMPTIVESVTKVMERDLDKWGPAKDDPGLKEEIMSEIGN
jgi:hypothetical protein